MECYTNKSNTKFSGPSLVNNVSNIAERTNFAKNEQTVVKCTGLL